MRAFIEYLEAGPGRIEVTSEFVVETKAHLSDRIKEEIENPITPLDQNRAYWDERMVNEDG